ncbi:MAG: type II methionyl aminopeptidase [Promethearchaeota archaeon]
MPRLDEDKLEKYRKAGKINAEAAEYGRSLVKPGMPLLDLAEKIESFILDSGASLSFPVNLSLNYKAAHDTPPINDKTVLPEIGLLKIDVGTHVDGYISDHAITVNIGGDKGIYKKLIDAASKALDNAIDNFKAGMNTVKIGAIIEKTIISHGFLPVSNLGGHNLERYSLHSGKFVPNTGFGNPYILKPGDVFAIEPFATNGAGYVVDGRQQLIFRFKGPLKKKLAPNSRALLTTISERFKSLPFSPRWLEKGWDPKRLMAFIRTFVKEGYLQGYNVLEERARGLVSQAEHTVIVHEDYTEIITSLT